MPVMLNIFKFLVVVYIIVLVLMYFFQERLIFFTQPIANEYIGLFADDEITIDTDGISLHGWFIKKEISEKSPLIIYYGGNGEEVSWNLLDMNRFPQASFLFINYRGYGKRQGKPTEKDLVKDALSVFDEMINRYEVDPRHIVLMGRSLGSGVAVQVAAKRNIRGLILVTPLDSLVNVAKSHYPFLPVSYLIKHRFNSMQYAGSIKHPALALLGTSDRIVPNEHSKALVNSWGGPMTTVLVPGAGHNDIQTFPEYWLAIEKFIRGLLTESED